MTLRRKSWVNTNFSLFMAAILNSSNMIVPETQNQKCFPFMLRREKINLEKMLTIKIRYKNVFKSIFFYFTTD